MGLGSSVVERFLGKEEVGSSNLLLGSITNPGTGKRDERDDPA